MNKWGWHERFCLETRCVKGHLQHGVLFIYAWGKIQYCESCVGRENLKFNWILPDQNELGGITILLVINTECCIWHFQKNLWWLLFAYKTKGIMITLLCCVSLSPLSFFWYCTDTMYMTPLNFCCCFLFGRFVWKKKLQYIMV